MKRRRFTLLVAVMMLLVAILPMARVIISTETVLASGSII